ncbi:MAG: hypothetical protein C0600_13775, partial [Ignavibacteria bacterium]
MQYLQAVQSIGLIGLRVAVVQTPVNVSFTLAESSFINKLHRPAARRFDDEDMGVYRCAVAPGVYGR